MALVRCPECGRQVSDKAAMCPGCGHPSAKIKPGLSNNQARQKSLAFFVAVVVFAVIAVLLWRISDYQENTVTTASTKYYTGYSYAAQPKTGKEGALAKAHSYLSYTAFSYSGLVDQLEYEGFSTYEAEYGADNCGAIWKDQALEKALSYLETSAFSYSGLREQLEFEGFTSDEAKYGVDNCDANWNEQAALKAISYLESLSFTRSSLYEQLEFEGFTSNQASYGVSHCGKGW
jgi:hypothetical protein